MKRVEQYPRLLSPGLMDVTGVAGPGGRGIIRPPSPGDPRRRLRRRDPRGEQHRASACAAGLLSDRRDSVRRVLSPDPGRRRQLEPPDHRRQQPAPLRRRRPQRQPPPQRLLRRRLLLLPRGVDGVREVGHANVGASPGPGRAIATDFCRLGCADQFFGRLEALKMKWRLTKSAVGVYRGEAMARFPDIL